MNDFDDMDEMKKELYAIACKGLAISFYIVLTIVLIGLITLG